MKLSLPVLTLLLLAACGTPGPYEAISAAAKEGRRLPLVVHKPPVASVPELVQARGIPCDSQWLRTADVPWLWELGGMEPPAAELLIGWTECSDGAHFVSEGPSLLLQWDWE